MIRVRCSSPVGASTMTDLMDDTLARVKEIVGQMMVEEFPGKKFEQDDFLTKLAIITHIAIRAALSETTVWPLSETTEDDDGHRDQ